jgi:hypothetical protein
MSEKRLLPAAALLMNSLKIIGNDNMQEIGALADLRSYLLSQETVSYAQNLKGVLNLPIVIKRNPPRGIARASLSQNFLV